MKIVFKIVFIFCFINAAFGQGSSDIGLWTSIGSGNELNKKIDVNYEAGCRLKPLDGYNLLAQIGLNYTVAKNAKVKLKYRYNYSHQTFGLDYKQRIAFEYTTKQKLIKKTKLSYRFSLQFEKENLKKENDFPYSATARNRVGVERKINNDIVLQTGVELFSNLINYDFDEEFRFFIGTTLDVGKKKELDINYIFDYTNTLNGNKSVSNIITLSYNFGW